MTKQKTFATYVRVSSREQADGYSPDAQLKCALELGNSLNYRHFKNYQDVGSAAEPGKRPGWNQVVIDALAGKFDALVIDKSDRVSRSWEEFLEYKKLPIERYCVKEKFEDTPSGRLCEGINAVMNSFYVDNLRQQVKQGRREKARQGYYPNRAPYGYRNFRDKETNKSVLVVKLDEAEKVKWLFETYASGKYSLVTLIDKFYRQGYSWKPERKIIIRANLHKMLVNPIYYGDMRVNGEILPAKHDKIIEKKTYDLVQKVLKSHSNGKGQTGYGKKPFTYSKFLRCSECGCQVTGEIQKGKYIYYRCANGKGFHKGLEYIPEAIIENQIVDTLKLLKAIGLHKNEIVEAIKIVDRKNESGLRKKFERFSAEQANLRNQISEAKNLVAARIFTHQDFVTKTSEWQSRIEEIDREIQSLNLSNYTYEMEAAKVLELAARAHQIYQKSDNVEDKQKLLEILLSNCEIDFKNAGKVHYNWKKPFAMLAKGLECPVQSG
jgi:site-specific DNA recombinase